MKSSNTNNVSNSLSSFENSLNKSSNLNLKNKKSNLPSLKKGRPSCLDEFQLRKLFRVYYSTNYSLRDIANMFGVSRMTLWRTVQNFSYPGIGAMP